MDPHAPSKIIKIGLLLSESAEYGRGVLKGIANYAKDHPNWQFRVEPPNRQGVTAVVGWKPDGVITMIHHRQLTERVMSLGKPVITVCKPTGLSNAALVQSDDVAVGRLGAEHLLERKAATYGFVGLSDGDYVEIRGKSFCEAIESTGHRCAYFPVLGRDPRPEDQAPLQ